MAFGDRAFTITPAPTSMAMRWFALCLVLSSSVAPAPARAQPDGACGAPIQNYVPRLPAPGEAYVGVATDLRGLAPVKPAIVVNILLPAGAAPLVASGAFTLGEGESRSVLELARAEFWVLGPGPRAASRLEGAEFLRSRSATRDTQYKLYLRVPPEAAERFVVGFPVWLSNQRPLAIPALAFRRTAGGPGIEICSVLPEQG